MSIRTAIVAAAITAVYWYFAGARAAIATYSWAADPVFGLTDETNPWPWRIVIIGYLMVAGLLVIAARVRQKRG